MTTPFNPYAVLEVSVDADADQIKAAFRRQVNIHHPDKGGDRDRYEEVIRANDVLSDAVKRMQFDKTWRIDSIGPDNMRAGAIAFIVQYFVQVMEQMTDAGQVNFCSIDLVKIGVQYAKKNVIDLRAWQDRLCKLVASLERSIKRLKKSKSWTNARPCTTRCNSKCSSITG